MLRLGLLRGPLRTVARSIGTAAPLSLGPLIRISARERLLVVSCVTFAGIADWELRRFSHAEAAARHLTPAGGGDPPDPPLVRAQSEGLLLDSHGGNIYSSAGSPRRDNHAVGPGDDGAFGAGASGRVEAAAVPVNGGAAVPESSRPINGLSSGPNGTQPWREAPSGIQQSLGGRCKPGEHNGLPHHQPRVFPEALMKEHEDLSNTHFRSTAQRIRNSKDKQQRQREAQMQRHPYLHAVRPAAWLDDILRVLDRVALTGPVVHTKREEVIRLSEGVRAFFNGDTGEAILALMQRTGCHAQLVLAAAGTTKSVDAESQDPRPRGAVLHAPDLDRHGFDALTLWGTQAQIEAALGVLPEMVRAISVNDSRPNESPAAQDGRPDSASSNGIGLKPSPLTTLADSANDNSPGEVSSRIHDAPVDSGSKNGEMRLEPQQPVADIPTLAGDLTPPIRAVWRRDFKRSLPQIESRMRSRLEHSASADNDLSPLKHGRPKLDSTLALSAYVDDLTTLPPRLLRRRIKSAGGPTVSSQTGSWAEQTTSELLSLFSEPAFAEMVSPEAADSALRFLLSQSNYEAMRRLFAALQDNVHYHLTSSNVDNMLAAAAKDEDMHNFHYLLHIMLRHRISPTWKPWVLLHNLVCRRFSVGAAARTLEYMRRKGILDNPQALREAACNGVERDLIASLLKQADPTLDGFLATYDARFGTEHRGKHLSSNHRFAEEPRVWLSTSAANRIIKILLVQGRKADAMAMVRKLEAAGEVPDTVTLNTFLAAARRSKDVEFAVAAVRELSTFQRTATAKAGIKMDATSYGILFDIAWRGRFYNMVRVIWRYACCTGEVEWAMQNTVRKSLLSDTRPPGLSSSSENLPGAQAGKQLARATKSKRGRKASSLTDRKYSPPLGMTLNGTFHRWAGKFAVGVADDMGPTAQPTFDPFALTPQEQEIHELTAQPRSPHESAEAPPIDGKTPLSTANPQHNPRDERLLDMLSSDLNETMSLRPRVPFAKLLELAWQKDRRWQARGLGFFVDRRDPERLKQISDMSEEDRSRDFASEFREMLRCAVWVPVAVGDALRARAV